MSRTRCALRGPGDPECGESVPLRPADPAPSPAARAAAAPRATRPERRPRPHAALTGERRGAGQGECECVWGRACLRARAGLSETTPASRSVRTRGGPLCGGPRPCGSPG